MSERMPRPIAVALLLGALSCSSPFGTQGEELFLLQTEGTEFQLTHSPSGSREVAIPYTYTNLTGSPVYLANCKAYITPSLEAERGTSPARIWNLQPDSPAGPGSGFRRRPASGWIEGGGHG